MKRLICVLITLFPIVVGYAQSPNLSLYPYNYFLSNPAMNDTARHVLTFSARELVLLGSSDLTGLVAYQGRLEKIHTTVGFINHVAELGASRQTTTGATAGYIIKTGEQSSLSLGTKVYFQRSSVSYDEFGLPDNGDPVLSDASRETSWLYDFGMAFNYGNFFAGVAGLNLANRIGTVSSAGRKYSFIAGLRSSIRNAVRLEHSLLVWHDGKELDYVDLNNKALILDRLWLGLTIRTFNNNPMTVVSSGVQLWKGTSVFILIYSNEEFLIEKDFNGELMLSMKL